jgi:SET domain-containing protein
VYATRPITKNTRIIHYAGEKISNQESLKRERRYIRNGHIWCFKLTNRTVIDAGVGGNDARFINHSCQPNCYIDIRDGIIWIRAARAIRSGEELTYNYNTDGEGLIRCRCRRGCQTLL